MRLFNRKAQAATELAVFGAILIFVIGSIVRSSIQAGMDQNQSLRSLRWALSQSIKGVRGGNKSRDSANLLVIEDRLSPDPGKFGSLERTPMIQASSGTFTNTLLMPMDWGEDQNISVMDVFVNQIHFAFTVGRFVTYDIQQDPADPTRIRIWDLTSNIKKYVPKVENGNWISDCASITLPGPPPTTITYGCPIFFTLVPVNSPNFCPAEAGCDNSVATFDQRFDLNLNYDYSDDPKGEKRASMLWQWQPAKGVPGNFDINTHDGIYPSFDIDFDRKEEVIYGFNSTPGPGEPPLNTKLVVQRVSVFDSQKGDINLNIDDTDRMTAGPGDIIDVGLKNDVSVYTITKEGTYLEIKQGKAYIPESGNFVRSTNRKDQVDIISRMFQLSNDTGRFCPPTNPAPYTTIGNDPTGLDNPVEACVNSKTGAGDCFNNITVSQTCFDKGTKMLFIRSRIQEQRGRKWVTQIQPY